MPTGNIYHVAWSQKVMQTLRELRKTMRSPIRRRELSRVIQGLDERLGCEPLDLGEAYRIRGGVAQHIAVYEFLLVDFAVDEERKFVLVRKVAQAAETK
jgi:mRNA-degrading endonuclease RelE of RelBE toxin-antitoxin system